MGGRKKKKEKMLPSAAEVIPETADQDTQEFMVILTTASLSVAIPNVKNKKGKKNYTASFAKHIEKAIDIL